MIDSFIEQIKRNLEANGFPEKKVSLPTEKMYEIADNKGLSLNSVLEKMQDDFGVLSDIGDEKIVFTQSAPETSSDSSPLSGMEGLDDVEMMAKAQDMLKNMDPTELKRMQDMFMNMSDEEKEDIMKKGRDMGFIK